tara:strand:+ start:519 stop:878 length:360 start_codon:yes stop_codon:yes gene_type:complete
LNFLQGSFPINFKSADLHRLSNNRSTQESKKENKMPSHHKKMRKSNHVFRFCGCGMAKQGSERAVKFWSRIHHKKCKVAAEYGVDPPAVELFVHGERGHNGFHKAVQEYAAHQLRGTVQ